MRSGLEVGPGPGGAAQDASGDSVGDSSAVGSRVLTRCAGITAESAGARCGAVMSPAR